MNEPMRGKPVEDMSEAITKAAKLAALAGHKTAGEIIKQADDLPEEAKALALVIAMSMAYKATLAAVCRGVTERADYVGIGLATMGMHREIIAKQLAELERLLP